MSTATRLETPITFSPAIMTEDALANYWLRQVTLRLRREISWLWHERGVSPSDQHDGLPPFLDPLQGALAMSRFWEQKRRFFEQDATARYLSDMMDTRPPDVGADAPRGSFRWVVRQLGLDDLSCFLLSLGLISAFDSAAGHVIAACLNDASKTHPNLALAQMLWDDPDHVLRAVNLSHPLLAYGLLQFRGSLSEGVPEMDWDAPFGVAAPVANQLLFPGEDLPDDLQPIDQSERGGPPLNRAAELIANRVKEQPAERLRILPIRGPVGSAHARVAQSISRTAGREVVRYQGSPSLLKQPGFRKAMGTLCWLKGFDLFLDEDLIPQSGEGDKHQAADRILPELALPIICYLGISERRQLPQLPSRHFLPLVDLPAFTYSQRVEYWQRSLGERAQAVEGAIAEFARRFRYGRETIDRICRGLLSLSRELTPEDLVTAAQSEVEVDIGDLAQRVHPRFQEEKLILPHKQERQFQEIIQAMRSLTEVHYRWGTARAWNEAGIAVLFAGPPGTGKTMGAEILAIELDLPMYRIDLSQVVNKYIGETEKNLKRLFDAADDSDLILFFDEADSLFGQRTEVRDAHDRYANLEISYLLERMERFKGLAILATNRKKDLDEAFLRRLRFIIDFPLPDRENRKRIWQQVTPKAVDASQVDYDFLAGQFSLAGGHIRSIVFNACLQSAGSGNGREDFKGELTMDEIIVAVKREYDKLKRPVSLEHFGPYAEIVEAVEHAGQD